MNMNYRKSWEHIAIKGLIWFVLILIVCMLAFVVYDRYSFHSKVYKAAISETSILEKEKNDYPYSMHIDSFLIINSQLDSKTKSQKRYSPSDVVKIYVTRQIVTANSDFNTNYQTMDRNFSFFYLLKDVDGLISANGLTFLVSLIVSLLIALLTSRIEKIEELINKYNDLKTQLSPLFMLYGHSANYNMILTRIESIYNLAILISNVTMSLPHPSHYYVHLDCIGDVDVKCSDSKSSKGKNKILLQIGSLCSRLSLFCDSLKDILNDRKKRLDYLTKDENNILFTYFEDTNEELDRSLSYVKDNQFLHEIIEDKIELVKEIRRIIETVEIKNKEER